MSDTKLRVWEVKLHGGEDLQIEAERIVYSGHPFSAGQRQYRDDTVLFYADSELVAIAPVYQSIICLGEVASPTSWRDKLTQQSQAVLYDVERCRGGWERGYLLALMGEMCHCLDERERGDA